MAVDQRYSLLDRLIHRVAFASPAVQFTAADVEATLFGARFRQIPVDRPIFVTSLPRAGTTLLLEQLAGLPLVATHLYRDMPFIMAPLLWEQLSGSFRKESTLIERAHGDGMLVGYDSPEAFEEVLWKASWPSKFKADRISLWRDNEPAGDFHAAFKSHMQRIVAARSKTGAEPRRYVSKNNANIARIGFLKRLFPDASLVVPFRDPLAQASSLHRQHQRFLVRHRDDRFGRRYMGDIGHFEFGALHRPIAFEGVDTLRSQYQPDSLDYWIGYWVKGFQHILNRHTALTLVSYERLCARGTTGLRIVLDSLGLKVGARPTTTADLHEPRGYDDAVAGVQDRDQLEEARRLHNLLLELSVV